MMRTDLVGSLSELKFKGMYVLGVAGANEVVFTLLPEQEFKRFASELENNPDLTVKSYVDNKSSVKFSENNKKINTDIKGNNQACIGSPQTDGFLKNWHNCKGTYWFTSGKKYVGAFWDGDFNGHGTLTFSSGKLLRND